MYKPRGLHIDEMRCLDGNSILSIQSIGGERFPYHSCLTVLTERTDRTDVRMYGCKDQLQGRPNVRASEITIVTTFRNDN